MRNLFIVIFIGLLSAFTFLPLLAQDNTQGYSTNCLTDQLACGCDDLPVITTFPRMYRRLVGANQWQTYTLQLNQIDIYITGLGGTINSWSSAYYTDASRTNLVAPATRYTPDCNPCTASTASHFVDYSTTSYYSTLTETQIYYTHTVSFTVDVGCGNQDFTFTNDYTYSITGATTSWQFVEPAYTCNDSASKRLSSKKEALIKIDPIEEFNLSNGKLWFIKGFGIKELLNVYKPQEIALILKWSNLEFTTDDEQNAKALIEYAESQQ